VENTHSFEDHDSKPEIDGHYLGLGEMNLRKKYTCSDVGPAVTVIEYDVGLRSRGAGLRA